jgi:hypothetical protein
MPMLEVVENFHKLALPSMCVGPLGIKKRCMHKLGKKKTTTIGSCFNPTLVHSHVTLLLTITFHL